MREWNTGFAHKKFAPKFSQYIVEADGIVAPRSVSMLQIQLNSAAVFATDLYSASVDERATPCCSMMSKR